MPTTPLGALIVPNTGDLPGSWGTAALNPNFTVIDAVARGVQSFSLAAATTFTLTAPSGSITPGAGPTQSQNAMLKFTGTLSGNAVITLPLPGYYIAINNCVVGASFFIQARAVGTGSVIGLPPGEAVQIYCDGTDVGFVGMGRVGEIIDTPYSGTPQWMAACTVAPYLVCTGQTFSTSLYPALSALLGSTYGGNGVTTFGVPDLVSRVRASPGSRMTSAGGVNGNVIGSVGGTATITLTANNLPASIPYTDIGHQHGLTSKVPVSKSGNAQLYTVGAGDGTAIWGGGSGNSSADSNVIGITINSGSPNSAVGVLPPILIVGYSFIKT